MSDVSDQLNRRPRGRPRAFHEKTEQNTIKSLDRAITVLTALAGMQNATLTDLAQKLNASPATIYRVLITFSQHGMVESDEPSQTWHIGPNAFLIGSGFLRRTSLVEVARPVLRALMEKTGETANLGIANDNAVLFVSQVETDAPIRAFFPPGTLSPLHASGIGKVLLAYGPPAQAEQITLNRFTEFTKTTAADLHDDLTAIRARGYAVDDQERNLGMRCIAAPISNVHGEIIAGVSVSGPTSRVTPDKVEPLAAQVKTAAAAVSSALGAK